MRFFGFLSVFALVFAFGSIGCGDDDGDDGMLDAGGDAATDDGGVPSICPPGECDLANQDCADPAEGCYFAEPADGGVAEPMCATAGDGALGSDCMAANDCEEGLLCIGPTGMMGTCRAVCCIGSDEPCPTGQECIVPVAAPGPEDTGVGACALPNECNLLAQDTCGAGEGCYPSVKPGITVCIAGGTLAEGAPCEFANDCVSGFACTDGECTKLCDRSSDPSGCAATQTCVELIGFPDSVGVCDPPITG